jgi:nucleotidyltransferase/DNA polymerase involved in DNA repair
MSVLYCRVPNFLISLACRTHPEWKEQPLALLGGDERIWAVSPPAWQSGVRREMLPRQARMRCPDLLLRPLDAEDCQSEQAAFLGALSRWELPVEAHTWGAAYLDLHLLVPATAKRKEVEGLCADMGRQVRAQLGEDLQPSLGWDSGKFTAQVAARQAMVGRMRLVGKGDEERFLHPLPVHMLPLPVLALQQLDWLGIRTLGQFAALPTVATWQRFGQAGKLAQQWSRGQDDRPVSATVKAAPQPLEMDFDPPEAFHAPVLEVILSALRPRLVALAERLEGCRRLRLDLHFMEGSKRVLDCAFVEPVGYGRRLREALSTRLQALSWPGELSRLTVTVLDVGELVCRQLSLFPELDEERSALAELVERLGGRYGELFFRGQVVEGSHPLAERRSSYASLLAA